MLLYKLTFPNGKCYIGQTQRNIKVRMRQHRQNVKHGSLLAVHCAWRKYGEPAIEVVGEYPDAASLHEAEIAAIKNCGTLAPGGYNVGFGGETAPSKSPLVAAKISTARKGQKPSELARKVAAEGMAERMADPEYRAKMTAANQAAWTPERRAEFAEVARQRATGVRFSDERRQKISAAKQNLSAETRAKMSASAKARGVNHAFTEQTRAKLSQSAKAKWADQDHAKGRVEAVSEGLKRHYANMSDEQRAEFSETRKRAWATRRANRAQENAT